MIASIAEQLRVILGDYPLLEISFLGNTMGAYIIFLAVFGLVYLVLRLFRKMILRRIRNFIKKTNNDFGNALVSTLDTIGSPFYWFLSFYLSINVLNLSALLEKITTGILIAWAVYQAIIATQILIDYSLNKYFSKEKDKGTKDAVSVIGKVTKYLLWLFGFLFVFSNIGINITSIVAGLGIGGIAIAFALQNILNDLFSSFAIFFDKPFVVGDFIVVGEHMGVVEKIGIKTTRLRALQGEEIVISNKELTTVRVQNFKKMKKRRVLFTFGVEYGTSSEKLKKIPSLVGDIIAKEKLTDLDRVHFVRFDDYALTFEVVYFILSGEYNDFVNAHQNILFEIKDSFEKEEISMAFPTQTILLENLTKK